LLERTHDWDRLCSSQLVTPRGPSSPGNKRFFASTIAAPSFRRHVSPDPHFDLDITCTGASAGDGSMAELSSPGGQFAARPLVPSVRRGEALLRASASPAAAPSYLFNRSQLERRDWSACTAGLGPRARPGSRTAIDRPSRTPPPLRQESPEGLLRTGSPPGRPTTLPRCGARNALRPQAASPATPWERPPTPSNFAVSLRRMLMAAGYTSFALSLSRKRIRYMSVHLRRAVVRP